MRWNGQSYHRFYLPTTGPENWKQVVGEGKWKSGFSAKTLAHAWEEANGFPPEVLEVLRKSSTSLKSSEFLGGFPEHPVHLAGGNNSPSMNDLFVLAKNEFGLITFAVEGKVRESFGNIVGSWKGDCPSQGKVERLNQLSNVLHIDQGQLCDVHYQLIHRTASAVLEAERFGAKAAVLLIHAFDSPPESYDAYHKFVGLFGVDAVRNGVVKNEGVNEVELYFVWIDGNTTFLQR